MLELSEELALESNGQSALPGCHRPSSHQPTVGRPVLVGCSFQHTQLGYAPEHNLQIHLPTSVPASLSVSGVSTLHRLALVGTERSTAERHSGRRGRKIIALRFDKLLDDAS